VAPLWVEGRMSRMPIRKKRMVRILIPTIVVDRRPVLLMRNHEQMTLMRRRTETPTDMEKEEDGETPASSKK
jgi:hypothetical protein